MTLASFLNTAWGVRAPTATRADTASPSRRLSARGRAQADRLRAARAGRRQPPPPALRLVWAAAPDGRGLVARWSAEAGPWQAPVTLTTPRAGAAARRSEAVRAFRPNLLLRIAAA